MAYLDTRQAFQDLKEATLEGIQSNFPMEGKRRVMELKGLEVVDKDLDPEDLEAQHNAKVEGKSWAAPVFGTVVMKDKITGEVVDEKRVKLADVPHMTKRHAYIVDGNEFQVDNQWRLKPGVYTRRKNNGELESQFNIPNKASLALRYDQDKKVFKVARGKSENIPAYHLMKELGVDDDTLEKTWGKDVLEANRNARAGAGALEAFFRADKKRAPKDKDEARQYFHEVMRDSKLRKDSTEITLGKGYDHVNGEVFLKATKRMFGIMRGDEKEDERDDLSFKDLHTVADFTKEQLQAWNVKQGIQKRVSRKIDTADNIRQVLRGDMFSKPVQQTFTSNSLARDADQVNPVEMLSSSFQTTIMGKGGIQSDQSITEEAKLISPSHLGFIDPIKTPEGSKTGVTLRLPMGVEKKGNQPTIPVYNIKSGKMERIDPVKFHRSKVVLPDQVKWGKSGPVPLGEKVTLSQKGNEIEDGSFKDAEYVMRSPAQMFSMTSNLIPFLGSNSGNRATYAATQIEQAISLDGREKPLVQVGTGGGSGAAKTFEQFVGSNSAHVSRRDGEVLEVNNKFIKVKNSDGKVRKIQMYDNFPLNDQKAVITSQPLVKPGDKVKAGQVVADNNFTQNGELALGTNLQVGYVPFKGLNFEDGVVISDSAAKKMSSVHMHKPETKLGPDLITDTNKYKALHPTAFTKDQWSKVDDKGIVRKGTKVMPGDPLILASKPYESKGSLSMSKLRKSLSNQHLDNSLTWKSDYPGEVVGVHKGKDGKMTVHVKTIEPMQIGDKMSGRYGNKGIVTAVVPDNEMPQLKNGATINAGLRGVEGRELAEDTKIAGKTYKAGTKIEGDVLNEIRQKDPSAALHVKQHLEVALNPSGVPGRMNMGQVLETAAAKIAQRTGKPYIVNNFLSHNDAVPQIKKELEQHGIDDEEELIDPSTGQSLGKALTGPQHMLKLNFQIDKKVSVRSGMPLEGAEPEGYDPTTLIPAGGGKAGAQSMGNLGMYSLLAHGAKHNIREMQTWKSEGPDPTERWSSQHSEVWRAIMTGEEPPPPKKTFAFKKFEDMMRAAGVNVERKGHKMQLTPLTDAQVLAMSAGEITDERAGVSRSKDRNGEPTPKRGGIFDPKLTGGHGGKKWTHMKLPEPMPNPVFEGAIQRVTGLSTKAYDTLVKGEKGWKDGKLVNLDTPGMVTGGNAISSMLKGIDPKQELIKAEKELAEMKLPKNFQHASGTQKVDALSKKVRMLRALDASGVSAEDAYTIKNLPVLPPMMRPATFLQSGDVNEADINKLYTDFGGIVKNMKDPTYQKYVPDVEKAKDRANLYDGLKALMGTGPNWGDRGKQPKGILLQMAGKSPKMGYFQDTLLSRRQDMTMRGTITPEPHMSIDEVGLPTQKALDLFRPFVVKKLQDLGAASTPNEAQGLLAAERKKKNPSKIVTKALDTVMEERPILLKRDPSLHKHSVQAFRARRAPGKAMQIHPLVTGGFGADFDGDCAYGSILCYTGDMPHDGSVASFKVLDLDDFPRVEETRNEKPNGIIEYSVPPNVYVPGIYQGSIKLYEVVEYSVHPNCEEWLVTTRTGRELRVSSDHSLALLGEDLTVSKAPPSEAVHKCLPVMRDLEGGLWGSVVGEPAATPWSNAMPENIALSFSTGWFIGASTGDGWVTSRGGGYQVNLAHGHADVHVVREWEKLGCALGGTNTVTKTDLPHEFEGVECRSGRSTISSTALGKWLLPLIGKGSRGKHIPERFLEMPVEFRRGLFCGLIDTDGTACWSKGSSRKKPQFSLSFTTTSERLASEIVLLGLSLGISSGKTDYENREKPVWVVTFSIPDVVSSLNWLKLATPKKQEALERLASSEVGASSTDIVPVTPYVKAELLHLLREMGAAKKKKDAQGKQAFTWYTAVKATEGYMLRETATRILDAAGRVPANLAAWTAIVFDKSVGWDVVISSAPTGEKKTMYDLTVPGALTFTMSNGAVVWDTMAAYVPIGKEAVKEAFNMMPSNNIYNEASGQVMYTPSLESSLGLFKLSRVTGDSKKNFKSHADLLKAAQQGKVGMTDTASVGGKKTTAGRVMIASAVPDKMGEQFLHNLDYKLDKKGVSNLYTQVAKDYKDQFGETAGKLMNLGYDASYGAVKIPNPSTRGTAFAVEKEGENPKEHVQFLPMGTHSFGLKDFMPDKKVRDPIVRSTQKKVDALMAQPGIPKKEKERRAADLWFNATDTMVKQHDAIAGRNPTNLHLMMQAGVKPSPDQYRQLTLAPMLLTDSTNRILPKPVTKSYSEGLDIGSYWNQMSGARRGSVLKVQEVREPGYFTKRLMNTNMGTQVTTDDCKTSRGISMKIDDESVYDRELVQDVKLRGTTIPRGTTLTPDVVQTIKAADKNANLLVRSALKCEHGKGLCQHCAGRSPDGDYYGRGTNVGVLATQALGERSTQLTLKAFHCLHEHSLLLIRDVRGVVQHTTVKRVHARVQAGEELDVFDEAGWVRILGSDAHVQQPGTAMVMVRTRSGYSSVSQDNHPHMLRENAAVCSVCRSKPKRSNGGKQYYCRNGCTSWQSAPPDDATVRMVTPAQIERSSHRATLALDSPKPSAQPTPIDDGWLAGMYCAEGSLITRQEKGNPYDAGVYFSQSSASVAYSKLVERATRHFGKGGPRARGFQVYSVEEAKVFSAFGNGARSKGLPDGWSGYNSEWLRDFVSGVIDGDGTIQECTDSRWKRVLIDTTSYLLAQQLHWILRELGAAARVILTKWRKTSLHQGLRVECVITERLQEQLNSCIKLRGLRGKPEQLEERFGDVVDYVRPYQFMSPPVVYDIETESGTFFTDGLLTHNSGGIAKKDAGLINDFKRVLELTTLPEKIPDAATVAMRSGTISKVENDPAGLAVHIGDKRHIIPRDRTGNPLWQPLKGVGNKPWQPPRVGMKVQAGQALSDPNRTNVNIRDLYKATNSMEQVQNHLVNELHGIYGKEGVRKQHVELVVRNLSDMTRVVDPGDDDSVVKGQFTAASQLAARNRDRAKQGLRPVQHTPVLKGIDVMPLEVQEDWMAKMNHNRLRQVVSDAAAYGQSSDLHGANPIPGMAYGAEFGMTEKDQFKKPHLKNVPKWAY